MSLLFGRNKTNSENIPPKPNQSIGSSALQKALERNRLKVSGIPIEKPQDPIQEPKSQNFFNSQQINKVIQPANEINRSVLPFEEKLKQLQADIPPKPVPGPSPFGTNSTLLNNRTQSGPSLSNPIIGPGNIKSPSTKWENIKTNIFGYFLKGMWLFSIILLLRLIFAERGVMEYYFRKKNVLEKVDVLEEQILTNKKITNEITRIQKDYTHQKSLVRSHLGFIADDEFIIVLPESKNNSLK